MNLESEIVDLENKGEMRKRDRKKRRIMIM